jgi:3',5'-cyclic AMP phosphodiesterase CpdA
MLGTINGVSIKTAEVTLPFRGVWTADLTTEDEVDADGQVTITIADLTLVGTVDRMGDFLGSGSLRIVGGAGGWMKPVPQKNYQDSFGLKLAPIVSDAAREVGETANLSADANRTLGSFFIREAAPAARVLAQLTPLWWVGFDGVTQVGLRRETTIASAFDVLPKGTDLHLGRVQIATDTPSAFVPGALFSSQTLKQQKISTVVHRLTANKLRTEVWTQ